MQKIQYAKGKSDKIAKLDGTYKHPSMVPVPETPATTLQQSIFGAPPGAANVTTSANALPPPPGLPEKPAAEGDGEDGAKGVKRAREEESEEEGDGEGEQAMDEESDVEMEAESDSD